MEHKINISEKDFTDIHSGKKTFIVQKNNFKFNTGDILVLEEFSNNKYNGNKLYRVISHIEQNSSYLNEDFVILGISKASKLYT